MVYRDQDERRAPWPGKENLCIQHISELENSSERGKKEYRRQLSHTINQVCSQHENILNNI